MSKVFSSCTVDVLQIFGKAMCFFQSVGVIDAYNFNHTNVNFNLNFEKYLQGFISLLEEIKVVLDRLYAERNKNLSKSCDYALSCDITRHNFSVQNTLATPNFSNLHTSATSHNYSKLPSSSVNQNFSDLKNTQNTQNFAELQNSRGSQNFSEVHSSLSNHNFIKLKNSSTSQNFADIQNNGTTQDFNELQNNSGEQNYMKLDNGSTAHSFTELCNGSNGPAKSFSELPNDNDLHKFSKLHNPIIPHNYSDFKGNSTLHNFTDCKNERTLQNYRKNQNIPNMENFGKLQHGTATQSFSGFKDNSIKESFPGLQRNTTSTMSENFNELPVSSNSQTFTELQSPSNLLNNVALKTNNSSLLVNNLGIDNQIQINTNQLINEHNDLNGITFNNSLSSDNQSLVTNNDYNIDPTGKMTDNQYIDHHTSGLTPGSQLISSAIESLVQESSNHEDEDDPLNSEEITFRPLDVINQDNNNSNAHNIDDSIWNKQQKPCNDNAKENDKNENKSLDKKSFKCNVCSKILSSKSSLAYHSSIHTGDKPFCCEHCGKLFTMSSNLAAHLTRQHNLNTESANSCPECGKLFVRKSALETHLAGHRGDKRYSCYICGKKFTQKVTCDTHVLTHTNTYPFSCNVCPKRFTSKSKLNFHEKSHGKLQYTCSLCDKKFSTKQYLNAHYKTHNVAHTEAAPCCLDTVSENSRTQVLEVSNIPCPQCDLTFKTQRALTRHTKTKHNPLAPWYHCAVPDCNRPVKSFATRGQLHKHNKKYHSGLKRTKYTCTTCGKEFAVKFNLLHHERQNHSTGLSYQQLRPFACHLCSGRFTLKSKLNCHIRLHSQTTQFSCDVCAKTFKYKETLRKHRLQQHTPLMADQNGGVLIVNSITCPRCGKIFKSKTSLMYHLQLHDGNYQYTCSTCGKKFVRKCHYDEHVRTIHTTERPFKCSTCGRSFKNKKYWREHIRRVHTSEHTVQSLLDSITNEDALTTQQPFHVQPCHVAQSQVLPTQTQSQSIAPLQHVQVQPQTNTCLPDVHVSRSFVLNSAAYQFVEASSSVP